MCGIVAATGSASVLPVLLDGLARLEYRGYDSAGVGHTRWATHGGPADTLGALRRLRQAQAPVLALTNVIGSAMAREASAVRPRTSVPRLARS